MGHPQHGYARQSIFELVSSEVKEDYASVVLRLDPQNSSDEGWANTLELNVEIRLGDGLWMEMRTRNLSEETVSISNCFHSYFAVSGIRQVRLPQVQKKSYLDKTLGYKKCMQTEPVEVSGEFDRVYLEAPNVIDLHDLQARRRISIETWGCENVVVWNPWEEKAKQMPDFDDLGYLNMICVEPANAIPESIKIAPGKIYRSGQKLRLS